MRSQFRTSKSAIAFAVTFLFLQAGTSQQTTPPAVRDPSAVAVMALTVETMDPQHLVTVEAGEVFIASGAIDRLRNGAWQPGKFRYEDSVEKKSHEYWRDTTFETEHSNLISFHGKPESTSAANDIHRVPSGMHRVLIADHIPVMVLRAAQEDQTCSIQRFDSAIVNGHDVIQIVISTPAAKNAETPYTQSWYIDTITHLPLGYSTLIPAKAFMRATEYTVRYGEFIRLGGITTPGTVSYALNNRPVARLRVTDIIRKMAVPTSRFEKHEAIQ